MFNNKKVLAAVAITSLLVASSAMADVTLADSTAIEIAPGPYLGGQLGWGTIHQADFSGNNTDGGVAGRLFAGYQFNRYFAAELGYTKFSNVTSNIDVDGYDFNGTIKSYAIDLVGKGILPLGHGFSLYGTLGGAYLNEEGILSTSNDPNIGISDTEDKIFPTFGAGISYALTSNVSADLGWSHIQAVGNNTDLANTDFVGLGVSYHF